jgi:hypothetical protein
MAYQLPNLWPDDIGAEEELVTPVAILRGAASQLGERTQQLITGDVATGMYGDSFLHEFYIVVPSLDHYRYKLFYIKHPLDSFYPLSGVLLEAGIAKQSELSSEEEFQDWLKQILSSASTKKLINTMLAQVRS